MILVARYIVLVETLKHIKIMFLNRIDNLRNHDNSIILMFLYFWSE